MEYTPTVQLSDTKLAEMSKRREATTVEASASASDRSVLETPQNLTNFSAEPSENIAENAIPSQPAIPPNYVENEANSMSNAQKSSKTLTTLGIALAIGAVASGGMYFLNQQSTKSAQNSIEEQVNNFNAMLDKQDFQGCYEKAVSMNAQAGDEAEANLMPKEQQQEFEAKCGLAKAQAEAEDLKYGEALAIAKTLPKNTSIDAQIQQQVDSWSEQLLEQATKLYEQEGNLEKAIETVKQIPQDSSVRSKVIDAKSSWKAESQANESLITSAEKALSEEKWQYAKQQATKVKDVSSSMYWQEKAKAIISQAEEGNGEATKAIAPTPETKEDPIPATTKVTEPNTNPLEQTISTPSPTPTSSKAVVPKPEPKPTTRVNQNSSEPLRDLGGESESLPGVPSNSAPENNAPLRDL
jgi:serine/threonine-protein kinase